MRPQDDSSGFKPAKMTVDANLASKGHRDYELPYFQPTSRLSFVLYATSAERASFVRTPADLRATKVHHVQYSSTRFGLLYAHQQP